MIKLSESFFGENVVTILRSAVPNARALLKGTIVAIAALALM